MYLNALSLMYLPNTLGRKMSQRFPSAHPNAKLSETMLDVHVFSGLCKLVHLLLAPSDFSSQLSCFIHTFPQKQNNSDLLNSECFVMLFLWSFTGLVFGNYPETYGFVLSRYECISDQMKPFQFNSLSFCEIERSGNTHKAELPNSPPKSSSVLGQGWRVQMGGCWCVGAGRCGQPVQLQQPLHAGSPSRTCRQTTRQKIQG